MTISNRIQHFLKCFISLASNLLISFIGFYCHCFAWGCGHCKSYIFVIFTLPTHSYCYILLIVFDESLELTVMNQLVSSESHHGNRDWRCVFGLGASANKLCDIQ